MVGENEEKAGLEPNELPRIYWVGEFRVDVANEELWQGDERLGINRRTFGVLRLLIERAGEVVSKQEFFDTVWADTFVEDNSLTVAITGLRKLLGDTSKEDRLIENLPRRGYRFTGEVTADTQRRGKNPGRVRDTENGSVANGALTDVRATAGGTRDTDTGAADLRASGSTFGRRKVLLIGAAACLLFLIAALAFNYRGGRGIDSENRINSIAVLPFENADADVEYLSDGLTETIINDLALLPNLRVISRNSTFQYKNKAVDVQSLGQSMNVRGILTGRVVRSGDDIVISAELVDLRTNEHVWVRRYERNVGDLLGLQKEISHDVADALRPNSTDSDPG